MNNVYEYFTNSVNQRGDSVASLYKENGIWKELTWNEMKSTADSLSSALVESGVKSGERVSIICNTRVEWALADLGILGSGAATVPCYQTSTDDEIHFILDNAEAILVIAEDKIQVEKLRNFKSKLPKINKVVVMDTDGLDLDPNWEVSWKEFLQLGADTLEKNKEILAERVSVLAPSSLLTLIYTSGTTGLPKGVVLSHDAMMYEAEAITGTGLITHNDTQYLFLPLSHVFAKVLEVTWFKAGHVMAFWEGDVKKIVDNLSEVRPTMMAAVPRIYEKIHAKVVADIQATAGLKGKLAKWAVAKGERVAKLQNEGKTVNSTSWNIARKLIFEKAIGQKLTARFGGRLRFFVSGGAPLSTEIAYFFHYAQIKICEGYGLTETSAASTVNLPDAIKVGTVGPALPGTEIRIAEDGEILIRGRGVMTEYWKREEATKETMTSDGWFKTGDIGHVDAQGYLKITDRKKDIIITAGGKNVPPQILEGSLKAKSPLISQVVVYGDQRKFLTVLLTLDEEALIEWHAASGSNDSFDYAKVSQSKKIRAEIQSLVDNLNEDLPRYETLKKMVILDHDFEIGDQMTPSLKIKRKLINERYEDLFNGMYE